MNIPTSQPTFTDDYYVIPQYSDFAQQVMTSIGILSACCSCFVALTIFLFLPWRNKIFTQLILSFSVSDFLGSVAFAFGFPYSPILCKAQASLTILFFRATWFYMTYLIIQLSILVRGGKILLSKTGVHLLINGINLLLELLPLIGTQYGDNLGYYHRIGLCVLDDRYWNIAVYQCPVLLCLFLMTYYSLRVLFRNKGDQHHASSYPRLRTVSDVLVLYPLGMLVFWMPRVVWAVLSNSHPQNQDPRHSFLPGTYVTMYYVTYGFAGLYGVVIALVFFINNPEARERWQQKYHYVLNRLNCPCLKAEPAPSLTTAYHTSPSPFHPSPHSPSSPSQPRHLSDSQMSFDRDGDLDWEHSYVQSLANSPFSLRTASKAQNETILFGPLVQSQAQSSLSIRMGVSVPSDLQASLMLHPYEPSSSHTSPAQSKDSLGSWTVGPNMS